MTDDFDVTNLDTVKENSKTGTYWDCPHCWWEGPEATIAHTDWNVICPDCNGIIDDRLHEMMGDANAE